MNKKLLVLFSSIIILLFTGLNNNYFKNSKIESNLLSTNVHAALIPRIGLNIDDGQVYSSGSLIDVRGWALNSSGVKAVDVYVDGKYTKSLQCNLLRPDVSKVFPDYPNAQNSGYDYKLSLNSGTHTIRVYNIGNDGKVIYSEVKVTVNIPQSNGLEPKIDINIDDGQTYSSGSVDIRGWALNSSGVKAVDVYIDGKYIKTLDCKLSRPDVKNVFPNYPNAQNSGYDYNSSLDNGVHTIKVYNIGNDGKVVYKEVKVTVKGLENNKLEPKMGLNIDDGQIYSSGSVDVRGWALNASGVKAADIYVDGKYIKTIDCKLSRPDVKAAFPEYPNAENSGYDYNLTLSNGTHNIRVYNIGNDGKVIYTEVNVTVGTPQIPNLQPRMGLNVDDGKVYPSGSTIDIRGWALNTSGVKAVDVYIDGKYMKTLKTNLSRTDVKAAFPQYPDSENSGYDYEIALSDGKHTIRVYNIGNDKQVIYCEASVTLYNFSDKDTQTKYNYSLQQFLNMEMQQSPMKENSNGMWVSASSDDVLKYLDPYNYINDDYGKFEFLKLTYLSGITADDINGVLKGKGVLENKGAVFLQAAMDNNINPMYLVSHALLETGNGTSDLATGISVNGKIVYNMFGIHAYDSNANYYGSQYAYSQSWFSVDEAIKGGAKFISGLYINNPNYNQDTLYKMRWNPNDPSHQYATDVKWAINQIYNIKSLIDLCPAAKLVFDIPIFN